MKRPLISAPTVALTLLLPLAVTAMATAPLPAQAQGASCTRPDKPKLPPGKGTKGPDMEATQKKVADYTSKMGAYLKCLETEKQSAQTEHKGLIENWNSVIDAYKKSPG